MAQHYFQDTALSFSLPLWRGSMCNFASVIWVTIDTHLEEFLKIHGRNFESTLNLWRLCSRGKIKSNYMLGLKAAYCSKMLKSSLVVIAQKCKIEKSVCKGRIKKEWGMKKITMWLLKYIWNTLSLTIMYLIGWQLHSGIYIYHQRKPD